MNIKNLLKDDGAVSPVIGVILMVAITVILAAVIATFVLGLGEQISETSPNASFTFDYDDSVSPANDDFSATTSPDGNLTITHAGGPNIAPAQISVTGSSASDGGTWESAGITDDVSAGDSVTAAVQSGDTVTVVWENEDGTESATLQRFEVP